MQQAWLYRVLKWQPQMDLEQARIEAEQMEQQYRFFCELKTRCAPEESQRVEHLLMDARRQMMDANSFLVALRRRGYDHALAEVFGERTIIEEEALPPAGENLSIFSMPTITEKARRLQYPWSSTASR